MVRKLLRALLSLDLEERILNIGSLIALTGVFLPWLSGEWLGDDTITYRGFHFYTAFIGYAIAVLHIVLLLITLIPLLGGPVVIGRRLRDPLRLLLGGQAVILSLAALTVLTKVTFEFTRVQVRYGIYVTLTGSVIAALYSLLKVQQQRKLEPQEEHFRHPEDASLEQQRMENFKEEESLPPTPPPPPLEPEDHNLR